MMDRTETYQSEMNGVGAEQQMERVLGSAVFAKAMRSQRLLRYLVAAALAEPPVAVKEYTIAMEVFDRGKDYDPAIDAAVRVEAGRLRGRLREYYDREGRDDRLLITIPKGTYGVTFTARPPSAGAGEVAEVQPAGPGPEVAGPGLVEDARAWGVRRVWALGWPLHWPLAAVFLVGLLSYGAWRVAGLRRGAAVIHSMAVLPLKNLSGDPGQEYFADGATDELITELARIPNLRVISWESSLQEKNSARPLRQIAEELRADAVVEGSVVRFGDRVRINTRLIDSRTENHLWAGTFEGQASEMMGLEDAAARSIAAHARLALAADGKETPPAGQPVHASIVTVDPAAHEAVLRGRNYLDNRNGAESVREFQRAVELDPTYAAAYAGLALGLETQALTEDIATAGVVSRAMTAAKGSLELDPDNGDGLIALGAIECSFHWDWQAAYRHLTLGVERSPSNALGRVNLSLYYDAMGDVDEAVRQMQTAVDVNPLSFFAQRHYGSALYFSRRYDEAIRQLLFAREMHPSSAAAVDLWLTWAYEKQGRRDMAVRYDLMHTREDGVALNDSEMLETYRRKGWGAYWSERYEQMRRTRSEHPCHGFFVGLAAMRAGRMDEAFGEMKTATAGHCFWMVTARVDPTLDDLRGDPRFQGVLDGLALPPAATAETGRTR